MTSGSPYDQSYGPFRLGMPVQRENLHVALAHNFSPQAFEPTFSPSKAHTDHIGHMGRRARSHYLPHKPAVSPRPEPGGFRSGSAKPPHSRRPGFELVPQPESLSVPLTRPFALATMLGFAALALRVWASTNGRPLNSGPFRLRDTRSRPRVSPFSPHCPALSPRLADFGFPLKDYAAKPGKTWLPPLRLPR